MSNQDKKSLVTTILRMEFPYSMAPPPPSSRNNLGAILKGGNEAEQHKAMMEKRAAREMELYKFSAEELAAIITARVQAAAQKMEAEAMWNSPDASMDIEHWSKAPFWTADEAVALLLGKEPSVFLTTAVDNCKWASDFAGRYRKLRETIRRAVAFGEIQQQSTPGQFLAWAQRKSLGDHSEQLARAVEKHGSVIGDWRTIAEMNAEAAKKNAEAAEILGSEIAALKSRNAQLQRDLEHARNTAGGPSGSVVTDPEKEASIEDKLLRQLGALAWLISLKFRGYKRSEKPGERPVASKIADDVLALLNQAEKSEVPKKGQIAQLAMILERRGLGDTELRTAIGDGIKRLNPLE